MGEGQGLKDRWRAGQARARERNVEALRTLERPGSDGRLRRLRGRFSAASRGRLEPSGRQLVWLGVGVFLLVVIGGLFGPALLRRPEVVGAVETVRQAAAEPYYPNCASAHADGVYSIRKGEPGYRPDLDADLDGVACEPMPRARRIAPSALSRG